MPQTAERKREYAKERWASNRAALQAKGAEWRDKNRDRLRAKSTERRREKRAMCLVAAARIRARRKGILFDLTDDDIRALQQAIDRGLCEVSGVELTLSGSRSATSPSLDRISPTRGYVSGNVRIVCHALNAAMGDWGEAELRRIVAQWLSP